MDFLFVVLIKQIDLQLILGATKNKIIIIITYLVTIIF